MNRNTGNMKGLAGWVVAAALAGVILGSGFQTPAEKYAVVDLRKVILDSKLAKQAEGKVDAATNSRVAVLNFIQTHRVITEEQAANLRRLELKETKTDAEKLELENLKNAVKQADAEKTRLDALQNPTEEERQRLMSLTRTFQNSIQILNQFQADFQDELQIIRAQAQQDVVDAAAKAATAVAKGKAFTVVFSASSVVYAANDITADTVKEANK